MRACVRTFASLLVRGCVCASICVCACARVRACVIVFSFKTLKRVHLLMSYAADMSVTIANTRVKVIMCLQIVHFKRKNSEQ